MNNSNVTSIKDKKDVWECGLNLTCENNRTIFICWILGYSWYLLSFLVFYKVSYYALWRLWHYCTWLLYFVPIILLTESTSVFVGLVSGAELLLKVHKRNSHAIAMIFTTHKLQKLCFNHWVFYIQTILLSILRLIQFLNT